MKRALILILLTISTMLLFSACNLDVVGKLAVTSFEQIEVKAQTTKADNQTIITSSNGNSFEYGPNGTAMKLPIAPFIAAGLDLNKLPDYATIESNVLVIKQDYKADDFKSFVKKYRDKVGYHEVLDHYGIDMGNGNKFEWAKDSDKNDKDIVFVLNSKPLSDAGLNVEKVEGFVYAEVEVKKGVKEFKLLAPYDLNNQTSQALTTVAESSAQEISTQASSAPQSTSTTTPEPKQSLEPKQLQEPIQTAYPKQEPKAPEKFDGIVINKSEITSTAKFIPFTIDGVKAELFAVKASDGSIKTAFNTCQVCYDSGRGYYIQQGDVFVCQNCGNQFKTTDIERVKGGCNPVPITKDLKTDDGKTIKIASNILNSARELFSDWKR